MRRRCLRRRQRVARLRGRRLSRICDEAISIQNRDCTGDRSTSLNSAWADAIAEVRGQRRGAAHERGPNRSLFNQRDSERLASDSNTREKEQFTDESIQRILGLALVAVFAFAAITAASASAKHRLEILRQGAQVRNKEYTGEFTDKLCSVAVERRQASTNLVAGIGKGKGFKGKGGEAILHNVIPGKGDIKVECASFKDAGSVAAPSGVFNVNSEFTKCKSLGAPCNTEGAKKETITTNKLAG